MSDKTLEPMTDQEHLIAMLRRAERAEAEVERQRTEINRLRAALADIRDSTRDALAWQGRGETLPNTSRSAHSDA